MEQLELSYAASGIINQYYHFGKFLVVSSKGDYRQTKAEYRQTPQLSTFSHIPNRNAYICSPKDIYKNIHSSTIPSSPKLETTQISIIRVNCGIFIQWNTTEQ